MSARGHFLCFLFVERLRAQSKRLSVFLQSIAWQIEKRGTNLASGLVVLPACMLAAETRGVSGFRLPYRGIWGPESGTRRACARELRSRGCWNGTYCAAAVRGASTARSELCSAVCSQLCKELCREGVPRAERRAV